ncbi:MAG: fatty acid desaturase [Planctomycetes bacterium]|nr:fatty acid desaturase [Planctomycetota bacterium]
MGHNETISEEMIQSQAWKFYFLVVAWPLYLFILPYVYARFNMLTTLFMLSLGVYLFTWLLCLMHECWHKYTPNIPNDILYNIFSYMLLTDPQLYRLVHGHHHSNVNTWEDTEFHPLGNINNIHLRRIYNFLEIALGIIFTFGIIMHILSRHPNYKSKYKRSTRIISILMWILFYGGVGCLSASVFNLNFYQIIIPFLLTFWLGSVVIHHDQLIEHGNLIVQGDYHERNIASRNLKDNTIFEKLFHLLTHGDTREHVLHHTMVTVYLRPFPGKVAMPADAVYISLKEYTGILWQMVRQ